MIRTDACSDHIALEKIHRFDHERIPERVVHARGAGAHGYFKVFDSSASKYTSAKVLTDSSRTTPVFVRFSTVQGSRGSADSVRDVRGFAIKFYTTEGALFVWEDGDTVNGVLQATGTSSAITFLSSSSKVCVAASTHGATTDPRADAIKFPDFVHAGKSLPTSHYSPPTAPQSNLSLTTRYPRASQRILIFGTTTDCKRGKRGMGQKLTFVGSQPETSHMVQWAMSDRGIPRSYRMMQGQHLLSR